MNEQLPAEQQPYEVFYFGCYGEPGHYLRRNSGRWADISETPFRERLDGGLLTNDYYHADTTPTGEYVVAKLEGWTAVSLWDRSGDSRGGCSSSFIVNADLSGEQLIELARQQWPQIFSRPNFPILKPKGGAV